MKLPKIPLAQTVIKLCELKGIRHVIISPGSRNAPLTIGFTNQSSFKCYSIVDERSAAFFALGIAQQLREPVALVCTSGSALLNYFPAVAEAYYSNIPLVVLSADRPKYLVGIGDGQTIDQKNVFGTHCLYSTSLKEDINPEFDEGDDEPMIIKNLENKFEKFLGIQINIQKQNAIEIEKALTMAIDNSGPVHINVPFSEPLYEVVNTYSIDHQSEMRSVTSNLIEDSTMQELAADWNSAGKKMILVGTNAPEMIDQQWIDRLASDDSVLVFTETTSNLFHPEFFPSIDKIIAPLEEDEFKKLQPELLLTLGGMVVSKKVKAFLRRLKPEQHWHVGEFKANDTFFSMNAHLKTDSNTFFAQFLPKTTAVQSDYKPFWKSVRSHRQQMHKTYLEEIKFSDLKAFGGILSSIPPHSLLQVGNSSAIRYTQLFDLDPTLKVFCNRGTSGIDGCTSTAIGAASVSNDQTVLITGDLGFFYDSNALWNNHIPNSFRIIVINNGGGGIFRILPGHKNTENFDHFFETMHDLNARSLCEMYGFDYISVTAEKHLDKCLEGFYKSGERPKLLEIFTPRLENDEILLNYFQYIK